MVDKTRGEQAVGMLLCKVEMICGGQVGRQVGSVLVCIRGQVSQIAALVVRREVGSGLCDFICCTSWFMLVRKDSMNREGRTRAGQHTRVRCLCSQPPTHALRHVPP